MPGGPKRVNLTTGQKMPSGNTPPPSLGPDARVPRQVFMKTKMCRFELMGACSKGADCPFAHKRDELKQQPDLLRTKLCKKLLKTGVCNVPECTYAHNLEELRPNKGAATYKSKPCRFFIEKGYCSLGAKCTFAHNVVEMQQDMTEKAVHSVENMHGNNDMPDDLDQCDLPLPQALSPDMAMALALLLGTNAPQNLDSKQRVFDAGSVNATSSKSPYGVVPLSPQGRNAAAIGQASNKAELQTGALHPQVRPRVPLNDWPCLPGVPNPPQPVFLHVDQSDGMLKMVEKVSTSCLGSYTVPSPVKPLHAVKHSTSMSRCLLDVVG